MNQYPVILIPDVLQKNQQKTIFKPIKPTYPKQPHPPPNLTLRGWGSKGKLGGG